MREACYECVYKHLSDAYVLTIEYHMGYQRQNRPLIVGNLSQAEQECDDANPELSKLIKRHRKRWQARATYKVPYTDLCDYVKTCEDMVIIAGGLPPLIPEACTKEAVYAEGGRIDKIDKSPPAGEDSNDMDKVSVPLVRPEYDTPDEDLYGAPGEELYEVSEDAPADSTVDVLISGEDHAKVPPEEEEEHTTVAPISGKAQDIPALGNDKKPAVKRKLNRPSDPTKYGMANWPKPPEIFEHTSQESIDNSYAFYTANKHAADRIKKMGFFLELKKVETSKDKFMHAYNGGEKGVYEQYVSIKRMSAVKGRNRTITLPVHVKPVTCVYGPEVINAYTVVDTIRSILGFPYKIDYPAFATYTELLPNKRKNVQSRITQFFTGGEIDSIIHMG